MDWSLINTNINTNTNTNSNSNSNSNLIQITRDNLNSLELGSYIKYIKDDKLISGGFLIKIINPDKIVYTELVLKSNIVWRLRFIKYNKIYKINNKINVIKNSIYDEYKQEIADRKVELDKEINQKIQNINSNKNKYKINIDN
jgi:uncharacterized protein YpmS